MLTGVTPEMACYAEETFGPVVSLYPVADDDEAMARANDSEYGLNGSVWTGDPERGRAVAAQMRCGTVNVNEGFAATFGSIDAPMGGMKSSGSAAARGGTGSAGSSRCSRSAPSRAADRSEPRPGSARSFTTRDDRRDAGVEDARVGPEP